MQQINLYQELVQEKKSGLSKQSYLIGGSLLLLLVLCYCVWQGWQVHQLKAKLHLKQAQLSMEISDLSLIQQQYPKQDINPLLVSELDHLQNITAALKRVVTMLSDQHSDKNTGFSAYFNALAEQSIKTIWLTEISINTETNSIYLQGSTYRPDTLPQLINLLNKEAVFKGRYFADLQMHRSKSNTQQINFTISTQAPKEKPTS